MLRDAYNGTNVFLTGHTGFKGSWLSLWLQILGARITGFSLQPETNNSIFTGANIAEGMDSHVGDIRNLDQLTTTMQHSKPEIVIHMAAQTLVRESYIDPIGTFTTNIMGTANLLEAVRNTPSVKVVLNITSDKCYENREWLWGYRENEPMGGHDPYSSSKGCAELVTSAYRRSFLQASGVGVASARAGNVIGGGDWAKDRIVPDAIRAFSANKPLKVRNPHTIRPWQHVLEPLAGYLILCQQLLRQPDKFSGGWNFGPRDNDAQPVSALVDIIATNWGKGAQWQVDKGSHPHEAYCLKLDCSKANTILNWNPIWDLKRALDETTAWYKAWHQGKDIREITLHQINAYQQDQQL